MDEEMVTSRSKWERRKRKMNERVMVECNEGITTQKQEYQKRWKRRITQEAKGNGRCGEVRGADCQGRKEQSEAVIRVEEEGEKTERENGRQNNDHFKGYLWSDEI